MSYVTFFLFKRIVHATRTQCKFFETFCQFFQHSILDDDTHQNNETEIGLLSPFYYKTGTIRCLGLHFSDLRLIDFLKKIKPGRAQVETVQ